MRFFGKLLFDGEYYMKNCCRKHKIYLLAFSAWLIVLCLVLAGCQRSPAPNPGRGDLTPDLISQQPQSSVTVFFKAQDSEMLVPLVFGINSSRDTIWIALEKLLAGPPDAFVESVIPQGVKMKDLYFSEGIVNIHLTGDVPLELEDVNVPAFWSTVNMELLEQDDTTAAVLLYYNEEPLLSEPYQALAVNDFGGGASGAYVYFVDGQAMYLVPLALPVTLAETDDATEEAFFAALLNIWAGAAPEESGVYSSLALVDGLQLLDVSLQDDVLTLNFSAGLAQISSSTQENLLLDSLMATLAPYHQISTVQLLADGQQLDYLPSGLEVDQPIEVVHSLDAFNRVSQ